MYAIEKLTGKLFVFIIGELSTWTVNQSVILTDYLDLSNPSTFLLQPNQHLQSYNANRPANITSPFCGPAVQILIMVTSAPKNTRSRNAIRETWGSRNNIWPKSVRVAFVLGRTANETIQVSSKCESCIIILKSEFKLTANWNDFWRHDVYHLSLFIL